MKKFEDYKISEKHNGEFYDYNITKITPVPKKHEDDLDILHCEQVTKYFKNVEDLNNCNLSYEEMLDKYDYDDWYELKDCEDFRITDIENVSAEEKGCGANMKRLFVYDGIIKMCDMITTDKGLPLFIKILDRKGTIFTQSLHYDERERLITDIVDDIRMTKISYDDENKISIERSIAGVYCESKWNDDFTEELYNVIKDKDGNVIGKTKFESKEDGTSYITFMY